MYQKIFVRELAAIEIEELKGVMNTAKSRKTLRRAQVILASAQGRTPSNYLKLSVILKEIYLQLSMSLMKLVFRAFTPGSTLEGPQLLRKTMKFS